MMIRTRQGFLVFFCSIALCGARVGAAELEVQHYAAAYHIKASIECHCTVEHAWQELTNYEHLAEWVPDMNSSRVVKRVSNIVLIEQVGQIGPGIFARTLKTQLLITEHPTTLISAQLVSGDFKQFDALYKFSPQNNGLLVLNYEATIEPAFFVLPVLDMLFLKKQLKRQFEALENRLRSSSAPVSVREPPTVDG